MALLSVTPTTLVHAFVRDEEVAPLCECGHALCGGAHNIRVQHCSLRPKEVGHRALNLEVGVDGAVEATGAAQSVTILLTYMS